MEAAEKEEKKRDKAELVFPKIPKDYKPSAKVMAMTFGNLPEGVDLGAYVLPKHYNVEAVLEKIKMMLHSYKFTLNSTNLIVN